MFIAEDFTKIYDFIACLVLMIGVLGIVSFVPATRGHWSAVVLALPSFLIGGYVTGANFLSSSRDQILPVFWFLFGIPFLIGACSIGWWAACRHAKRLAASKKP